MPPLNTIFVYLFLYSVSSLPMSDFLRWKRHLYKTCELINNQSINVYFRTPTKKFKVKRSWLGVTEIMCSLMSLVMNIETFIFFPLFLLEWRGDGLLIYLLLLGVIGAPVFLMETIIGRIFLVFFISSRFSKFYFIFYVLCPNYWSWRFSSELSKPFCIKCLRPGCKDKGIKQL